MKPIITTRSDFEYLIQKGGLYVDKTEYLYRLVSSLDSLFFISRPRRFGKTLMLSTLQCIFEGKKELFQDLEISKTDYDWQPYPVMSLDMSGAVGESVEDVKTNLNRVTRLAAESMGISVAQEDESTNLFFLLWSEIRKKKMQVVVLVDEYDMPLQGFLNRPDELERVRKLMHDFYVQLKAFSNNIRFLMMTGVSKFSKLSIFSGLNNLLDLTMDPEYAALLGYTEDELDLYFRDHIQAFADAKHVSYEDLRAQLRQWYNGYHFTTNLSVGVYNPVSLGKALSVKEFDTYWSDTGSSTLIVERLNAHHFIPDELDGRTATKTELNSFDLQSMPLEALLIQGGYLTIKSITAGGNLKLGIPNQEIRTSLNAQFLRQVLTPSNTTTIPDSTLLATDCLAENNVEPIFTQILPAMYSSLPHDWAIHNEAEAKRYFYVFIATLGADVSTERQMALGRPDAVLKTPTAIYIIEFKYNQSSQKALDQIHEKHYADAFANDTRKIIAVGLNFNPEIRTLDPPLMIPFA